MSLVSPCGSSDMSARRDTSKIGMAATCSNEFDTVMIRGVIRTLGKEAAVDRLCYQVCMDAGVDCDEASDDDWIA